MTKGYSLVLQFRGDSLADFDAVIALEEKLTRHAGRSAQVDGHDCGSGEINIFILSQNPQATFDHIFPVIESDALLSKLTAAFRKIDGNDYTIIWPKDCAAAFKVT